MAQGVVAVPLWIPQLGYAGGLVILFIAFLDEFVHVLAAARHATRSRRRRAAEEVVERAIQSGVWRMELVEISGLLLLLLVVLLAGGVWIAIALMACGFVGMQFVGGGIPAGSVLATTIWGNAASWTLAALPLFIWMGEILFRTRLSEEMFRGLSPWLNWLPGRLLHVNVLACGIFGSVSGSSAATCATVAKIALPELKKRGYDDMREPRLARRRRHARHPHPALDHHGGLRGRGERLDHPGLPRRLPARPSRDGALFRLHRRVVARSTRSARRRPSRTCASATKPRGIGEPDPVPAPHPARLPVAPSRLGDGDRMRRLGRRSARSPSPGGPARCLETRSGQSVMGTTRLTCMIMLILAGASFMSTSLAYTGIPIALATWVDSLALSPYALIAALTVMYILLGTALDGISMIVLTTAVVIPMIKTAGFDLVWFGIFLVLVVEMAEVSPPVGFNLFVLQTMSGKDSNTVALAALPFFFLLVAAVAIITVFPDIVMVLPKARLPGLALQPRQGDRR